MARVTVVTSGKGGVGKTTSAASFAAGLALKGKKTVVIDFDVGLRNLDIVMGCERRVVYDLVNVVKGEANVRQALIKDKRVEELYVLPASQTRDKDALDLEGIGKALLELKKMGFEEIAGTERIIQCELALLAIGFVGAEKGNLLTELGVELDNRGNIKTENYKTTAEGVFSAGDMRRGQSLVVWAISEGREAAKAVDTWLMGYSHLESKDESFVNLSEEA